MSITRIPGQTEMLPGAMAWEQLVLTSGLVSSAALTGADVDIAIQIREALAELRRVLTAAGTGVESVLRLEAFLADAADFGEWNRQYAEVWPSGGPARTTLVSGFVSPAIRFELQATAFRQA